MLSQKSHHIPHTFNPWTHFGHHFQPRYHASESTKGGTLVTNKTRLAAIPWYCLVCRDPYNALWNNPYIYLCSLSSLKTSTDHCSFGPSFFLELKRNQSGNLVSVVRSWGKKIIQIKSTRNAFFDRGFCPSHPFRSFTEYGKNPVNPGLSPAECWVFFSKFRRLTRKMAS